MNTISTPDRFAAFKAAWRLALIRELNAACTDGTAAIAPTMLLHRGLAATVLPAGAPTGTNPRWVLHQDFLAIIATFPGSLKQKLC